MKKVKLLIYWKKTWENYFILLQWGRHLIFKTQMPQKTSDKQNTHTHTHKYTHTHAHTHRRQMTNWWDIIVTHNTDKGQSP